VGKEWWDGKRRRMKKNNSVFFSNFRCADMYIVAYHHILSILFIGIPWLIGTNIFLFILQHLSYCCTYSVNICLSLSSLICLTTASLTVMLCRYDSTLSYSDTAESVCLSVCLSVRLKWTNGKLLAAKVLCVVLQCIGLSWCHHRSLPTPLFFWSSVPGWLVAAAAGAIPYR